MLSENAFLSTGSLGQTHCNRLKVLILVKDEMHLPKQKEPQITLANYMVKKMKRGPEAQTALMLFHLSPQSVLEVACLVLFVPSVCLD